MELVEKYPQHCFSGVEATAYFPEDKCKIHVLIYGLDRDQFSKIQKKRKKHLQIAGVFAQGGPGLRCGACHLREVNNRLTLDHLEKLIVLFNNFEGRNGSRSVLNNDILSQVLQGLTPDDVEHLAQKHDLEPWGRTPWLKGLTGGSDDHAGLFIGKTSTRVRSPHPAGTSRPAQTRRHGAVRSPERFSGADLCHLQNRL